MYQYDRHNSFVAELYSTTTGYDGQVSTLHAGNSSNFDDEGWLTVSNATFSTPPRFWFRRLNVDNPEAYYEIRLYGETQHSKTNRDNHVVDVSRNQYLGLYSSLARTPGPVWTLSQPITHHQLYKNVSIFSEAKNPIQAYYHRSFGPFTSFHLVEAGGEKALQFEINIVRYGDTVADRNRSLESAASLAMNADR